MPQADKTLFYENNLKQKQVERSLRSNFPDNINKHARFTSWVDDTRVEITMNYKGDDYKWKRDMKRNGVRKSPSYAISEATKHFQGVISDLNDKEANKAALEAEKEALMEEAREQARKEALEQIKKEQEEAKKQEAEKDENDVAAQILAKNKSKGKGKGKNK